MYPEHEGSLAEAAALPMQKKMFKENGLHKNVKKYHLSCESALTAGHCMLLSTPSVFECGVRRWLDAPWPSDESTGRKVGIFQKGQSKHLSNGQRFYLWSTKKPAGTAQSWGLFHLTLKSPLSLIFQAQSPRLWLSLLCLWDIYASLYLHV